MPLFIINFYSFFFTKITIPKKRKKSRWIKKKKIRTWKGSELKDIKSWIKEGIFKMDLRTGIKRWKYNKTMKNEN